MGDSTFPIWSTAFHCSNLVKMNFAPIWSTIFTQFGHLPNGTNLVIYDQIGDSMFPIWSTVFHCPNLVKMNIAPIWSTIFTQFGHLRNGTNLVKSWCIPIWSTFFVGTSSVLLQFGQLTFFVCGVDQYGHILVRTNLVTICTYIPSTNPIWSTVISCPLDCPIWSKIQLIENEVVY